MIYDKRLALIEYIVFYSTPPADSVVNVRRSQPSATGSRRGSSDDQRSELVSYAESGLRQPCDDSDDGSQSGSSASAASSGRSSPAELDSDVLRAKPVTTQPGLCGSQLMKHCVVYALRVCMSGTRRPRFKGKR